MKINGKVFQEGQFIFINNPFNSKVQVPESYPKEKVDPIIYPEHWRKPDVYRSDHHNTCEPYQIVRLEQIVGKGRNLHIRVRKMYRPHDTHLSIEEARKKPLTVLYWTDEIVR